MIRRSARALTVAAALMALAAPASSAAPGEPDCDGPAPEAAPGTPQWEQREADNVFCGQQRSSDTSSNPLYTAAATQAQVENGGPVAEDPFRDPDRLAGSRFRYEEISFANGSGDIREGLLFRPCDASCRNRPAGLGDFRPPYPAVVIVHGGAAYQEMYHWASQALAESGYMVLTFQVPERENAGGDAHYPDAKAALGYLLSTPQTRVAGGRFNPRWTELDRERIGVAGHSAGGVAVSRLGQEDPRVSAVVSWDRAQSGPMPPGLRLRTPALFVTADFNCQRVPVCLPERYATPPDPLGPGNKDEDFQRVSAARIDSMKIALRAATHLDFTEFAPTPPSSRYGAIVSSYYTLAWFDRYLKGAGGTLRRLTAATFDDSADRHYISGGRFDPATQSNVPARIASRAVRDRLSFHFRSAYYFNGGRLRCEDIRAGCPAGPVPAASRPRCGRPRFLPRSAVVRRGRAAVRPVVTCGGRRRSVVVRLRSRGRFVHVVTGRRASLAVLRRQRRIPATYTLDGRRHAASILLRRAARARFAG